MCSKKQNVRHTRVNHSVSFIYFIRTGVFIVGAKRTAFGTFGGSLKNVTGTQLQTAASKAALAAANVQPTQVDSVTIGNVLVVSSIFRLICSVHIKLHRIFC